MEGKSGDRMETKSGKRGNWAYGIFLCAMGFFVVGRATGFGLFRALYPYLGTIALPGLMVLLGREARSWLGSRRQAVCAGGGLLAAGYLLKVLVYWVQTALGKAPAFYPFSTSGVAWPFLVAGLYLLLAGVLDTRRYSTRKLLAVTLAVGLAGGLIRPLDSFLCLGQLCAFAPFFVLGSRLDLDRLEGLCAGWAKKWAAAGVLVLGLRGCVLLRNVLKSLWPIVDGDSWYGASGALADRLLLGPAVRLGWYGAAAVLLLALFCLSPKCRLPVLTRRGGWAVSGYYFAVVLAYLTMAPLGDGVTWKGLAGAAVLMLLVLVLLPSGWSDRQYRKLSQCVWNAWEDREQPQSPLAGKGFYQRHRWGIQAAGLFTLCFVIAAVGYVYPFLANGKSLIWDTDGMGQQYPMMFYCKEYLLSGIQSFLETGAFSFPQWDFTLGFGMSPVDALRREPFMLLSLLGNEANMEVLMDLTAVLRLYVCGLAFLWLCRTLGHREKAAAVMGALVYIFCGFSLFASVRQPYFVTVLMTYQVLMLVGAERYIQRKKYGIFVLAVFLQLFGGYYTAYINGLVLALYLLVRLGCLYGKDIRKIVATIGQLIGFYAWGAGMSMMNLLPGILSLFGSSRSQGEQTIDLFYSNTFYRNVLTGLNLEFNGAGYWTYLSLASIGWVACILLFLTKEKGLRPYKIGFTACMVLISLPITGMLANGFAYISNRWCYCIPLLVSLILVEMVPRLLRLTWREKGWILVVALAYAAVAVTRPEEIGEIKVLGLLILVMTVLIVTVQDQFIPSLRLRRGILLTITVLTVSISCAVSYLPEFGNYVSQFQERGLAYETLAQPVELALEQAEEDEGFYRVARAQNSVNQSMALGYYGTNAYYSVIPSGISDYCADIGLAAQTQTFRIRGLDERTTPNALACVNYYVAKGGQQPPYGFAEVWSSEEDDVTLYENQYLLPLGYTYDSYVTLEEYQSLSMIDRQEVMLESGVIGEATDALAHGQISTQEQIPCEVSKLKDVVETDGVFEAEEDGTIQFTFQGEPGCESYLVLEGFRLENENANSQFTLSCKSAVKSQNTTIRGKGDSYYFQRDGVAFHLGYSEEAQETCTLTFGRGRTVTWDACYVVCIPMEDYPEKIADRTEAVLEQVSESGDRITGTLELKESRLLALSVPYAPGWKAYVNGEEAELLQVNVMYCGLLLEPGSYEITLEYEQPGQKIGTVIAALSFAAIIPAAVLGIRRRKQRTPAE